MDDKIPYAKPYLDYPEQLQQLKDRGLNIENDDKALHLLSKVSYYRLSGYWHPLLEDPENHRFKQGATFEVAFKLYCFDKDLRKLFLSEIEKIEVAIRCQMIHVLSESFGPFWFEKEDLFPNKEAANKPTTHEIILNVINKEFERCDEQFIEAFKLKYANERPPCWMLLEIMSFGTLSMLYKSLKPGKSKRLIANNFGLDDTSFESWLHCLVYVRNICAHHSRLWNRSFSIRPAKVLNPDKLWLESNTVSNKRIFYFASMLVYLLNIINPKHRFKEKFLQLITSNTNLDYNRMGFCDDWENEPLWQ
jgi:abortive infection bacteriophage resistance protein